MNVLNDVLRSIISVSLISSLGLLFLGNSKFREGIKYLSGIVLLSLILQLFSPLISALTELTELSPDDVQSDSTQSDAEDDLLINESARQIAEYLKALISGRFDIPEEELNVSVLLLKNDDTVNIKSVSVGLFHMHIPRAAEISEYVSNVIGCECVVIEI